MSLERKLNSNICFLAVIPKHWTNHETRTQRLSLDAAATGDPKLYQQLPFIRTHQLRGEEGTGVVRTIAKRTSIHLVTEGGQPMPNLRVGQEGLLPGVPKVSPSKEINIYQNFDGQKSIFYNTFTANTLNPTSACNSRG